MKNNILIVAAHPDDEILGCGGVVAKHAAGGDSVKVLIMAEGITSRSSIRDLESNTESLLALKESAKKANAILGVNDVEFASFPDNRMDSLDLLDVVKKIEAVIETEKPNIIYTHYGNDVNVDHQIVYSSVITACRPQPGSIVKKILCFETVSSTEWQPPGVKLQFSPNWFVDIDEKFFQKKMDALQQYASEMREFPHPRSVQAVEALARWRGASVGFKKAESFMLIRSLNE